MGIPFNVINERFNLEFEEFPGWDMPIVNSNPFANMDLKTVIAEYNKQEAITIEKGITIDKVLNEMEYKKSLDTMLIFEKEMMGTVKQFYANKYKQVISFIEGEKQTKDINKDTTFIARFIEYLKGLDFGKEFVEKCRPVIERIFNNGVYRTYRGIGMDFSLNNERAINHLIERGLILQDSPKVVLDSIVTMLESDSYTIDTLAKDISKKWDEATLARAKAISITETTYAYSSGRETGMKELGIKKKMWVHSHDSLVRPNHNLNTGDNIALVGDKFKNGLMRPGDGGAADACNCRCVLVSVL